MNKVIFFFCALFQKQTATVLLSCILLSSAIGCSENLTFENNAGCSGKEYVKEARNIEGFIYFDDEQKKYAISSHLPGTYDAIDVGFICAMPDSLKTDGLKVKFDGRYYQFDQDIKPAWAGVTYYYLSLDKVSISPEK